MNESFAKINKPEKDNESLDKFDLNGIDTLPKVGMNKKGLIEDKIMETLEDYKTNKNFEKTINNFSNTWNGEFENINMTDSLKNMIENFEEFKDYLNARINENKDHTILKKNLEHRLVDLKNLKDTLFSLMSQYVDFSVELDDEDKKTLDEIFTNKFEVLNKDFSTVCDLIYLIESKKDF